jgi:YbbR domain-containing protein
MGLRNLILRNFWLKLFSVALATVIWLAIHYGIHNDVALGPLSINRTLAQEYVRVPVTIRQRAGDSRVFRISPNEVIVVAVGEDVTLRQAAKKSLQVYVDLTDFESKDSSVEQLQSDAPADINVIEISPSAVTVQQVSP